MRKALLALTAAGLLVPGTLTGCSSGGDDTESGGATVTTEGAGNGQARVGVILPDEKSSARWTTDDPNYLKAEFEREGVPAQIVNAKGDKERFKQLAKDMVGNGVKVLVIVSLDAESGKAAIDAAHAAKVPVIDYDRLTLGGNADYYVSFNNATVGKLQGQGLIDCLTARKARNPLIAGLHGSPTDNNATQFKAGADAVLQEKYDSAAYTRGPDQPVPDWDNAEAGVIFKQMFQQFPKIGGVLAANDGLANAAIEVLRTEKLNGKVPVTGQDATVQGLQNILRGDQCMTVYKSIREEANQAALVAVNLFKGVVVDIKGPDNKVKDPTTGSYVKFIGLQPQAINSKNMKSFVASGAIDKNAVCAGEYAALCRRAGIK